MLLQLAVLLLILLYVKQNKDYGQTTALDMMIVVPMGSNVREGGR